MDDHIDIGAIQRCAGGNIRRTDRAVTQFYDAIMAPSGLSGPQFGLLASIAEVAPITINHLAAHIGMDRTTLTRNLDLLSKQQLVCTEEGDDRRQRLVLLTAEGEAALQRAWPLWQEAQARIEQVLGGQRLEALLAELAAVRASVS